MSNKPWFLIFYPPVHILSTQVVYIWQVPWWAGFRFALLVAFLGLLLFAFFEHLKLPRMLVKYANIITGGMLGFMLVAIAVTAIIRDTKPHEQPRGLSVGPDIYFIVLDSYTGSQSLQERFGYDNTWFLDELRNLGFQVGDCTSRYTFTSPTLSSLWNGGGEVPTATSKNWKLVQRSQLRTELEQKGYDMIAFATGYDWDEIHDAAYYLEPDIPPGPTEFEMFVIKTPWYGDRVGVLGRARTLFLLDNLDTAADLAGSQFTFAHIVQPHPPFVFNADGSPLADASVKNADWTGKESSSIMYFIADYDRGYIGQVEYISHAILEPLRRILEKTPDALIMLLGDHGPWYSEDYSHSILCSVHGDLPLDPADAVKEILK